VAVVKDVSTRCLEAIVKAAKTGKIEAGGKDLTKSRQSS
jgi:hypothetical protein